MLPQPSDRDGPDAVPLAAHPGDDPFGDEVPPEDWQLAWPDPDFDRPAELAGLCLAELDELADDIPAEPARGWPVRGCLPTHPTPGEGVARQADGWLGRDIIRQFVQLGQAEASQLSGPVEVRIRPCQLPVLRRNLVTERVITRMRSQRDRIGTVPVAGLRQHTHGCSPPSGHRRKSRTP